jgi:hypothetical protein
MSPDKPVPPNEFPTIQDFITQFGRRELEEPALCTSWILVCEWSNGENYWISTIADEDSPSWRHDGLLNHAAQNYDELLFEDSEEDDEDE